MNFQTTHNLDFYTAEDTRSEAIAAIMVSMGMITDDDPEGAPWSLYRVGTCHGQWRAMPDAYEVLSVVNDEPHNGHFDDVMQWFEMAAKRDGKALRIRDIFNPRLKVHLMNVRGFEPDGSTCTDDLIKRFEGDTLCL